VAHQIECALSRQTCEWWIGLLRLRNPEWRASLFLNGERSMTTAATTKLTHHVRVYLPSSHVVWCGSCPR